MFQCGKNGKGYVEMELGTVLASKEWCFHWLLGKYTSNHNDILIHMAI